MVSGSARTAHTKPLLARLKRRRGLLALLAIPVIYVFIFNYMPMYGVLIAFQRYNPRQGILGSPWVGMYHILRFLRSVKFTQVTLNTIYLSLYSLIAGFPIPILLAIGLTHLRSARYRKTVQMITYAPYFLSTVVLVALFGQLLNMRSGILNRAIMSLGASPINFMGNATSFRHVYVWSGVWQEMGYGAVIYIAALAGVDPELHEAASIDGASMWRRIFHIDLPGIKPTVVIMLILRMGSLLNVGFEKVYLFQNATNQSVSEIIATYVYKVGLTQARPDLSFATAVGLFQNIVSFALVMSANWIASRISDSGFF